MEEKIPATSSFGAASNHQHFVAEVVAQRATIKGWPTNMISIDFYNKKDLVEYKCKPKVILIFIPGNPGLIEWYSDTLIKIVQRLGPSYAARGISYAGHGISDDVVGSKYEHKQNFANINNIHDQDKDNSCLRDMSVPWTIEGQIVHKLTWIDGVMKEFASDELPRLIFMSHSFGAYLVQHVLLRRPDLLIQTHQIIHLMPFFRFDPPKLEKLMLSSMAHSYEYTIPITTLCVRILATLPRCWIDSYLNKIMGIDCEYGRRIALDVFTHPRMVKNHLVLGFEEIRFLPELPNDVALRILGRCPTSILFCGNPDQWAPKAHMEELKELKRKSLIKNIHFTYIQQLRHDFIVHPDMIEPVIDFVLAEILSPKLSSKL